MSRAPTPSDPPGPPRVRLEGTLDMVRASDQSFTVITPSGVHIPGRLVEGRSIEDLARCLNDGIVLFGTGRFDPAGNLLSAEANGFLPGLDSSRRLPQLPGRTPEEREEMARRLKSAVGTWPGDETDEAVDKALRELS